MKMLILVITVVFLYISKSEVNAACGCSASSANSSPQVGSDGIFEGDIKLTDQQIKAFTSGFRNMIYNEHNKWPGGVVPYKITSTIHKMFFWQIPNALDRLSKATNGCISFRKATEQDKDYVEVIHGDGCYSFIGRLGGKQQLSLGYGCTSNDGTIQHEFLHALGFHHEQNRSDRDNFVTVHWENVDTKLCHNFVKWGRLPQQGYDIVSVMHYGEDFFSCNGKKTMTAKSGAKIKGHNSYSATDILKIKELYNCQ